MKLNKTTYLLIVCISAELMMQTICRNCLGPIISPIVHFVLALLPGMILLLKAQKASISEMEDHNLISIRPIQHFTLSSKIRLLFLSLIFLGSGIYLCTYFRKWPVDMFDLKSVGSDVIPQIMFFTKRTLAGAYPYSPISPPSWGYTLYPTYLPFQWMPYLIAEIAQFDYRWIPFIALFAGFFFHQFKTEKSQLDGRFKTILLIAPALLWLLYIKSNHEEFKNTVECLVTAYYLFLAYSRSSSKTWVIAIALIICLLSRYSLVFWVPLFLLTLVPKYGLGKVFKIMAIIAVGILLIYGPFFLKDPHFFSNGYLNYTLATHGEWEIQPWQQPGDYPPHIGRGLGLAIFFYKINQQNIDNGIHILKIAHLVCSIAVIIILAFYYWRSRNKVYPTIFAIASLKIYLTVFYGFIQIPYSYLYILPLMLNIPILYYYLMQISTTNINSIA